MKKFLIKYMLITALFVALTCHATVFATFEGIDGHWAEETIMEFVEKDYLSSGDFIFEPDSEVTKGEVATIINRYFAYGFTESEEENLKIATENGYLANSEVSEKITREEVAILICKTLSLSSIEESTTFSDDNEISLWAKGYVATLKKEKIVIGYPDNTFHPKKNITKAEFVTVLNRCIGVGGKDLEILDTETSKLEVGTFEAENGEIKFIPIDKKIELKSGDCITLALKIPGEIEEEIKFDIIQSEIIDFDEEFYTITALQKGIAEIKIQTKEDNIGFQVVVE